MAYSLVGIAAILVCIIINISTLFKRRYTGNVVAKNAYRLFLLSLITFFISDIIWGFLDKYHLINALYVDTTVYFLAMCLTIFFWTIFVSAYLEEGKIIKRILVLTGIAIMIFAITVLIINIFNHILFYFDDEGVYHARYMRYVLLTLQLFMFVLTSIYVLVSSFKQPSKVVKNRYYAIGVFGIVMAITIIIQVCYPLYAIYAVGCMIGLCIVHIFVVGSEKEEQRKHLEDTVAQLNASQKELTSTKSLVYIDPLTGAKSKYAYVEMEEEMDRLIACHSINEFAVVVFDINGLKVINDTKGHEAGDQYIKRCYRLITESFKTAPIYRFGGDEFVAVLEGSSYVKRKELFKEFNQKIDENVKNNDDVVSSGISDFNKHKDNTYRAVFIRADQSMYIRKKHLKGIN